MLVLLLAMSLPFTYGGCGGGGGGGGAGGGGAVGTAPTISDVKFYKIVDGVPVETLIFDIGDKFNFDLFASDPDLDMDTCYIEEYLLPDIDVPYGPTIELILPTQTAVDMVYFAEEDSTVDGPAGTWRECFWMVDTAGNESNEFCVNVVVNAAAAPAVYLDKSLAPENVFDWSNITIEGEAVE